MIVVDFFHFSCFCLRFLTFSFVWFLKGSLHSARSKVTRVTVGLDTEVFEFVKLIFRPKRSQHEPEGWKQLHVTGVDGISCQHLQALMLRKPWKWQEDLRKTCGTAVKKRPTMYLASMDLKTPFRRGKTKAKCEDRGRSRRPWMDGRFFTRNERT